MGSLTLQEYECKLCNRKLNVDSVIPHEGYDENILACGHRFYKRTARRMVAVGNEGGLAEPKEITVFEGELPCLLVYSDQKHVSYINDLLSLTENSIRAHGFKPQRLSREIKSGQDYFATISSLLDSCALVLVILDGLRPNVVFEFGYAMAKSKPVIIIRSKGSVLSIKTLYERSDDSGLTGNEWNKLKEPILRPPLHLSDFAGKQIPV